MTQPPDTRIDPALLEQAIAWQVRLLSGEDEMRWQAACQRWCMANPQHEQAWQCVQQAQQLFGDMPAPLKPLAGQVLARNEQQRVNQQRRRALKVLGVAAVALPGALVWQQVQPRGDYLTGAGERRHITLANGAQLTLNTRTRVDVLPAAAGVQLRLAEGELLLDNLAASAPLTLLSGDRHYRIGQGSLLLRQWPGHDVAQLLQGEAQANGKALPTEPLQVEAQGWSAYQHPGFDPSGWLDGALVAKDMRLGHFIAELARYRRGWLQCDSALAQLPVSGVFQLGDTDRVLATLAHVLPLRIRRVSSLWARVVPA